MFWTSIDGNDHDLFCRLFCFCIKDCIVFGSSSPSLSSLSLSFSLSLPSIFGINVREQVFTETVWCWFYLWECITNRFSHIIHVIRQIFVLFSDEYSLLILIFLHLVILVFCAYSQYHLVFRWFILIYKIMRSSFSHHICYAAGQSDLFINVKWFAQCNYGWKQFRQ